MRASTEMGGRESEDSRTLHSLSWMVPTKPREQTKLSMPVSAADTPFLSAKRKVERANHHIEEAKTRIANFLANDFHPPFVDKDPKTGDLCLNVWHPGPHILPGFSTIVGDTVHNLRSALDHTISDIVRMCGGNDSDVHFPMHETRIELEKAIDRGLKKKIGPDLCRFIIKTIKPYRTGNYPSLGSQ
jgi:hypothetical protein